MGARNYAAIQDLLDTVVFGEHTIWYLLTMAAIALVSLIATQLILSAFKKAENRPRVQTVHCIGCGWKGKVSLYAGRCPQCNQALGKDKTKLVTPPTH